MSTLAPPRELKVLIAGFGSVGRRHYRNLMQLGVEQVGFYRSSRSTLPVDEIGACHQFRSLDEALEWKPSVVLVANPTALHLPVAAAAARAGIDLFVEKPLSHSMGGCDELVRCARGQGLVAAIGCQFRFHPLLRRLRERMMIGDFGAPLAARAEYGDGLRTWHPWEDHRASYSARKSLGGGAILTLIHPLDSLYWLFGPVSTVHASTRKAAFLETDVDDDIADMTLEFACGVVGHVHVDFIQDPPTHVLEVLCEGGRARLDFIEGTLRWWPQGAARGLVETVPDGYERNTMFLDEMADFLDRVKDRGQTRVPLEEGVAVLDIALKASEDAQQRKS